MQEGRRSQLNIDSFQNCLSSNIKSCLFYVRFLLFSWLLGWNCPAYFSLFLILLMLLTKDLILQTRSFNPRMLDHLISGSQHDSSVFTFLSGSRTRAYLLISFNKRMTIAFIQTIGPPPPPKKKCVCLTLCLSLSHSLTSFISALLIALVSQTGWKPKLYWCVGSKAALQTAPPSSSQLSYSVVPYYRHHKQNNNRTGYCSLRFSAHSWNSIRSSQFFSPRFG